MNLSDLNREYEGRATTEAMPVLFIGHGSPMNGIENNLFTAGWKKAMEGIPTPRAVVCISAHWLTRGTYVTAMENPRTIHDFGGFPAELYKLQYPAPGSPRVASEISGISEDHVIGLDHEWGLDHGTWSVVRHLFPKADIPVLQLSIDYHRKGQHHYHLAQSLSALRRKGVLFIGSGNMVHNLGLAAFDKLDQPGYGYDWAVEINETLKKKIQEGDHRTLMEYHKMGTVASLAIPTPDHYWPLIYTLGLTYPSESTEIFNDVLLAGSLTMTSVKFG